MAAKTKPAVVVYGGSREVEIADWKPHLKNTLQGFFTAKLPSGMVLHGLMLHEKDGARWITTPGREWVNAEGEKQYAKFIEFRNRATADRFRDSVLAALDAYLGAQS